MHLLLTEMSLDRLTTLYEALPEELVRALDVPIGKALNSRPGSVARRPVPMRMKALRAFLKRTRDDTIAGELLRAYLLGPRKDLVVSFLDATGVAHEEGEISDDSEPAADKVGPAVEALLAQFDREDVVLYLEIATRQWPENEAIAAELEKAQG
ncbi:MAG: hypothetical protein H6825_04235 [Planctomycetes bacterium]|nr:hypothetical protein [Planctomycetota bacterium]